MTGFNLLPALGQMAEDSGDPRARALLKALTATGAPANHADLTGGLALRLESIDKELALATLENSHFKLFNRLFADRETTWSLINEVTVQTGIGGFLGSSVANERGTNIPDRNGEYGRLITQLKLFSEKGSVTLPATIQATLQQGAGVANWNAAEQEMFSALTRMTASIEWTAFFGDANIESLEINGLIPTLMAKAPASSILDARGTAVKTGAAIATMAARLTGFGKFGAPDVLLCSQDVKSDFDSNLESTYRVHLDKSIPVTNLGADVQQIRYNALSAGGGLLDLEPHIFLDENLQAPKVSVSPGSGTLTAPGQPVLAKVADGASRFEAGHAGTYYYSVEACKPGEVSTATASATAVTVAAGEKVTVTIAAVGTETSYNVYRSKRGGSNVVADHRLVGRITRTGGSTVFTDYNTTIPGTSKILLLTTAKKANALAWLQMLPPAKIPLAMTALDYVFQTLYIGALRVTQPGKHGLITNVLPSNAIWLPF